MSVPTSIKVFAPATVANVGCGYDVLGFPVEKYGDTIKLELRDDDRLVVQEIEGADGIPFETDLNVSTVSMNAFFDAFGDRRGFDVFIDKNIPPGSGLGSSASSSVAAVYALNEYLGIPFTKKELIAFAMEGERAASSKPHADNVAPSLLGGFTIIRSYDPLDVFGIPSPSELRVTVIYPHIEVKTSDAKKMLRSQVKLSDAVRQWGNVAGMVSGLILGDFDLIGRSLQDVIVEPVRSILIPYYEEIKSIALDQGALGFNISGSGPSMFALTRSEKTATAIRKDANEFLSERGIDSMVFTSRINGEGAKVV